jgi:hypothetical protein
MVSRMDTHSPSAPSAFRLTLPGEPREERPAGATVRRREEALPLREAARIWRGAAKAAEARGEACVAIVTCARLCHLYKSKRKESFFISSDRRAQRRAHSVTGVTNASNQKGKHHQKRPPGSGLLLLLPVFACSFTDILLSKSTCTRITHRRHVRCARREHTRAQTSRAPRPPRV